MGCATSAVKANESSRPPVLLGAKHTVAVHGAKQTPNVVDRTASDSQRRRREIIYYMREDALQNANPTPAAIDVNRGQVSRKRSTSKETGAVNQARTSLRTRPHFQAGNFEHDLPWGRRTGDDEKKKGLRNSDSRPTPQCNCQYHVSRFGREVCEVGFGPNRDWCRECDSQQNIINLQAHGWI